MTEAPQRHAASRPPPYSPAAIILLRLNLIEVLELVDHGEVPHGDLIRPDEPAVAVWAREVANPLWETENKSSRRSSERDRRQAGEGGEGGMHR